ncbi:dual specificity protein phosphatase 1-like isoform X1 [Carex rostrata]
MDSSPAGQEEREETRRGIEEEEGAPVMMRKRVHGLLEAMFATRMAKEDNLPCLIDTGLYLGSFGASQNREKLKAENITHVLTVAASLDPAFPDEFIYKNIDVLDTPQTCLDAYFQDCIDFIDQAKTSGGAVFVHCFAGRSRSATIVVAYLMKKNRMTRQAALSLVTSRRPLVAPNPGFIRQLDNFEKSLGLSK